jgi:hypothetical protein
MRILVYYGNEDLLADPYDVKLLIKNLELNNNITSHAIEGGHATFLWGKDMTYLNEVLEFINSFN